MVFGLWILLSGPYFSITMPCLYHNIVESIFCRISNLIRVCERTASGPFFTPKEDNGAVVTSIGMAKPNVVTATRLAEHLCEFEIGCRVYDEGLSPPC